MPEPYISQSIRWLTKQRVSGIAIGRITIAETKDREANMLHIAQRLKRQGNLANAILLLQYAHEKYPGQERVVLEEADCWIQGQQWQRAYELLAEIESPSDVIKETIQGLRQVMKNG